MGAGLLTRCWRGENVARRGAATPASFAVMVLLVFGTLGGSVAFPTARIGPLASMFLATAKGTPKIFPARIAGVSKEANPTVTALDHTVHEARTGPQEAIQRALILTNKRLDAFVLVPILAEREKFRNGYNKTDRVSVIISVVLCISSSYSLGAEASRGRARIFFAVARGIARTAGTTHPSRTSGPRLHVGPASPPLLTFLRWPPGKKRLLGKATLAFILSFQVVGQFI